MTSSLPKDDNNAKKRLFLSQYENEVDKYIARCREFQEVKVEDPHPTSLLEPLPIPDWKW